MVLLLLMFLFLFSVVINVLLVLLLEKNCIILCQLVYSRCVVASSVCYMCTAFVIVAVVLPWILVVAEHVGLQLLCCCFTICAIATIVVAFQLMLYCDTDILLTLLSCYIICLLLLQHCYLFATVIIPNMR